MASEPSAVSSFTSTNGTIGKQASVLHATLQKNAEWQAIAERPLKIPDLRQFGVGSNVDMVT